MAASSWWRIAPARWLFKWTATVPIHRRQDGQGPNSNVEIFAACHQALARGEPGVVPRRRGAPRARVAPAQDRCRSHRTERRRHVGVTIAIRSRRSTYEDQGRFRSQAVIHVGRPIEIDDWTERYRGIREGSIRAVTEVLTDRLRDVTLNHAVLARGDGRRPRRRDHHGRRARGGREPTAVRGPDRVAPLGHRDRHRRRRERRVPAPGEGRRQLPARPHGPRVDDPRAVPRLHAGRIRLRQARLTTETVALLPFAVLGVVLDGPVVLAANVVTSRPPRPIWQATAKALTGFLLPDPVGDGDDARLPPRRRQRRRAVHRRARTPRAGTRRWPSSQPSTRIRSLPAGVRTFMR